MASICNDDWASLGVMSGHERKTLRLSARIPRLIGVARMTDLMLTGRVFDADEAERIGRVQYRATDGAGLARGIALAQRIATNAPVDPAEPRLTPARWRSGST